MQSFQLGLEEKIMIPKMHVEIIGHNTHLHSEESTLRYTQRIMAPYKARVIEQDGIFQTLSFDLSLRTLGMC